MLFSTYIDAGRKTVDISMEVYYYYVINIQLPTYGMINL